MSTVCDYSIVHNVFMHKDEAAMKWGRWQRLEAGLQELCGGQADGEPDKTYKERTRAPLRAAGYKSGTISNWAAGRGLPSDEVPRIAALMGWRQEYLNDGSLPKQAAEQTRHVREVVPAYATGSPPEKGRIYEVNLAAVNVSSGTTVKRAPVIAWARLGVDLSKPKEQFGDAQSIMVPEGVSERCKWVVVEEDLNRFGIKKGYKVALEPELEGHRFINEELYLFRTEDAHYFLAEFRRLAGDSFEAIPASGMPMDRDRHGLTIVARHMGTWKW
jgi:hypothetical protein